MGPNVNIKAKTGRIIDPIRKLLSQPSDALTGDTSTACSKCKVWNPRTQNHGIILNPRDRMLSAYSPTLSPNKANLRDLIAATGLVILLKFDPIHRFFSLCDLEIWCMTLKDNRAPLLYYIKLCVSFQIHGEFKLKLQSGNAQFGSKSAIFLAVWPWNLMDDLGKQ